MVLHDLNLACRYADHLVAMGCGTIVAEGPPGDIVDAALVAEVFGLASRVLPDPLTGTPMVVPVPTRRRHGAAERPEAPPADADAEAALFANASPA
jgi:iron complex transport system ATP-binding protein